ncbi:NAD-dependent epimerase/dehydratase family protein [Levilactobacillus fujinensis]|uniref:NAD-dependent epimerase/dehydratase family protein n=1 Tax=Levilactobacillus fujinensis TaxID=2486024 RepID=A0ABW1TI43_9LACO|nr:NAD-dependent epimerase/dehydratase family protein [Levilactobacillus fujinensis]
MKTVLVTGGNGFLALHIIQNLLTQGYQVRATLRTLTQVETVRDTLAAAQTPHLHNLTFVAADLTQAAGWQSAMAGIDTVMSVAAPVFVNGETVTDTTTSVATSGTLRILEAAVTAHVRRVIMTANLGAVGFSRFDHTGAVTEADWTDPEQPGLSPYEQSKLVAEQQAWAFAAKHPQLELVTVNAGAMLGPALGTHVSGSFGLVKRLLAGQPTPNFTVNVVDVRDVAAIHVLAMTTPTAAGKRILAVADTPITAREMLTAIRTNRPALTGLTRHLLPTWLVRSLTPFSQQIKEVGLMMRLNHNVSNQRARTLLGWQPISSATDAVLAAVDSLTER